MSTKKIVVLGGRGMLGTDLIKVGKDCGFEMRALDLPEFDIANSDQLREVVEQAEIVINCAAYTNVEKAESESDLSYAINADAVGELGKLAKLFNTKVIHISTDFVFDGDSNRPYLESDAVNPLSVYGSSKQKGEQLLLDADADACIIRIQWTYGKAGTNFVFKMIELAKSGRALKVIDDQVGGPTATVEVAKAICQLIERDEFARGIFHFAAAGSVSRYEMACFIFEKLSISADVSPCKASDFKTAAKRPLNSCFNCDKIQSILSSPIKDWQEPLSDFLESI